MTFYTAFVSPQANEKYPPSKYREIAQENMKIFDDGVYTNTHGEEISIAELRDRAREAPVLYKPDYKFTFDKERAHEEGAIEITPETTTGACYRLIVKEGFAKTVALNFANPHEPGGGFRRGAIAQEECICRTSVLFNILDDDRLSEMYVNVPPGELFSDYMSLAKSVPMFRGDDYEFLDAPFPADFITCAAPMAKLYSGSKEKLNHVLEKRIRKIVQCAAENEYEVLVLGAFGCGAFGNDTRNVANMFKKVLFKEKMRFFFKKIVFAIYSSDNEKDTIFRAVFTEESKGKKDGCTVV